MKTLRNIIEIDEELCNGCGQCILDCAEGALEIVDGKAKLVGELFCDGLGACLSGCPTGALTVTQREAEEFDEEAVEKRMAELKQQAQPTPAACGCASQEPMSLEPTLAKAETPAQAVSLLEHWPIKLQLLNPQAPFLQNADLVLLADCAGAAMPDLHQRVMPGRAIALACPKLDDVQAHLDKLASLLAGAKPKSLTIIRMEVPCCKGLEFIALKAAEKAGLNIPMKSLTVGRKGDILAEEPVQPLPADSLAMA